MSAIGMFLIMFGMLTAWAGFTRVSVTAVLRTLAPASRPAKVKP